MIKRATIVGLIGVLSLLSAAQAEDKDADAELEIGGVAQWGLPGGGASYGPSVALEFTPIPHWLEVEVGVGPQFGGGRTVWDTEFVLKKPFTLSDTVEFMIGVGPEWLHPVGGGKNADSAGGEALLDFQFWASPEHKFGWFIEPSYGYDFGRGHEQDLGVTVGVLIAIP